MNELEMAQDAGRDRRVPCNCSPELGGAARGRRSDYTGVYSQCRVQVAAAGEVDNVGSVAAGVLDERCTSQGGCHIVALALV